MANAKQATTRRLKMAERAQQLLELHFPGFPAAWLWQRKTNDGFTTIPRTLPLVMQAIDAQSKGHPAGHTLLCLWVRSPDNPMLTIENPATFASEAGFYGERAVDTWRRRMKRLRELDFIRSVSGPTGEFHYVLLLNPNAAVEHMKTKGLVQDGLYGRFRDRLVEVGGYGELEALRAYYALPPAQPPATLVISAPLPQPPVVPNTAGATPQRAAPTSAQAPAIPLPPNPATESDALVNLGSNLAEPRR